MEIALNTTELIHLYLKNYITDVYIRQNIIDMKYQSELQDNIRYHNDTWQHIASAFYYAKDNQRSYVYPTTDSHYISHIFFSSNKPPQYIIIPDNIKDFYNITNISYQTRELLFDLIKTYAIYGYDDMKQDDILYSKLSKLIHIKMYHITNTHSQF